MKYRRKDNFSYKVFENGAYKFVYSTDASLPFYEQGYAYFYSLPVKRESLGTYDEKGQLDCGLYRLDEWDNCLSEEERHRIQNGWEDAKDDWVEEQIKDFVKELKSLTEKYNVSLVTGCCYNSSIKIDGTSFDIYIE